MDFFSSFFKDATPKLTMYTAEVEGAPEIEGEGKPRRSIYCTDKLISEMDSGAKTLLDNFKEGLKISKDQPCFGKRPITNGVAGPYVFETYQQVYDRIINTGSAFVHRGLAKGSMVGIFAINSPEWMIVEQACAAYGMISVPLYDTLGPEAIEFIINQTEMTMITCTNDKIDLLLKEKEKYPTVKTLVLFGGMSQEEEGKVKGAGWEVVSLEGLQEEGKQNASPPSPSSPTEMVTVMYTSGTTGLPKGVMLSHQNIIADAGAVKFMGSRGLGVDITKDDVHLSYLPLAHVFERMIMVTCIGVGACVGFFQGNTLKLLDDIAALQPTIFPSVPRLLNRIYDKVNAAVEAKGGVAASLFNMAVASKKEGLRAGYLTHWLWDKLVFGSVKQRLGGRVNCIVTGSAPISSEVLDFLRLAFCCEVLEGYGQTESCAGSTMTLFGDYEPGHVGPPLPCNEIKLVDVAEMNYTSKDKPYPRGEICFRGPNVFMGYYKNEEKTKEALDDDGWLHSGDIGLWDEKGRVKIIDRKKNIFKLAQGEYIAPEKIENVYCKSKYVAQAFVYGDSLNAFLVSIIIPDEEVLLPWTKQNGVAGETLAEVIKDPSVKKLIFDDMIKTGKELGLKSFEQVKGIHLDSTLFSVDNNLLTPTFKLKRPQAKEHYQKEIDQMTSEIAKKEADKEKKQNLAEEQKTGK